MDPIIIKVLEPIGFKDSSWIDKLKKEFPVKVFEVDTRGLSDDELIKVTKDATALVLTNRPLSQKVLKASPKLKFISVAFAGLDHIDLTEASKRGIIVKNAAGYATHAVAELTIGLALQLSRQLEQAQKSLTQKDAHLFPPGRELFGKTVGVIGSGAIGKEVKRLFTAFGCKVLSYHRGSSDLEKLLKESDIITIHLPLSEETKGFINKERLALMKPSAVLLNTARGPVIDQEALIDALKQKKIAGAALDVFEVEPPLPQDHPLFKAPDVLLTPHIGYRTEEAILEKATLALTNLYCWIQNRET